MLYSLNVNPLKAFNDHSPDIKMAYEGRYDRDEKEDLKTAIDYLYEFKKKLTLIHPEVLGKIERMLQIPNYYR